MEVVDRNSAAAVAAAQAIAVAMAPLAAVDLATAAADTPAAGTRLDGVVQKVLDRTVGTQVEMDTEVAPRLVEATLQLTAGLRMVCLEELEDQA